VISSTRADVRTLPPWASRQWRSALGSSPVPPMGIAFEIRWMTPR
jgi:hypothetical protein